MIEVKFYDEIADEKLKFAVILAKTKGKWVFCKHKERMTYEVPGGRREPGESILHTAMRELYEETGALLFDITPVCVYSVVRNEDTAAHDTDSKAEADESYGMLYFAEIESILITEEMPTNWTYPLIQPKLLEYAKEAGFF